MQKKMINMKKIICGLLIVCGLISLSSSILCLLKIPDMKIISLIVMLFSCVYILVVISEIRRKEKTNLSETYKIILKLLTYVAFMLACVCFLFTPFNPPVFIKIVLLFTFMWVLISLIRVLKKTNVVREKEIVLSLDYESAFQRSGEALKNIKGKIKEYNKKNGVIIARTRMSWKSNGEELSVNLESLSNNQTQIKIISKPFMLLSLFEPGVIDFGKNLDNVNKFTKFVYSSREDM